jgi:hypothetical protein
MRATAFAQRRPFASLELPPTPAETPPQGREERLAAWATLLERRATLSEIRALDFAPPAACDALRKDGSAASVAFADPTLRAAGLRGDSVSAVREFFQLNLNECHRVLCQCGTARVFAGPDAAATVRRLARRRRIDRAETRLCVAVLAGLGGLLGLRLLVG